MFDTELMNISGAVFKVVFSRARESRLSGWQVDLGSVDGRVSREPQTLTHPSPVGAPAALQRAQAAATVFSRIVT